VLPTVVNPGSRGSKLLRDVSRLLQQIWSLPGIQYSLRKRHIVTNVSSARTFRLVKRHAQRSVATYLIAWWSEVPTAILPKIQIFYSPIPCRVVKVADISKYSVFIFRVKQILFLDCVTLKLKALYSFETSADIYHTSLHSVT
jgi:hypothetical protein